jgi:WXG100 family type VII secretion target
MHRAGSRMHTADTGTRRVEIAMPKAHVDPAELRHFARDLARFNQELQTLMTGLHARLRALEQTWKDQEQRKFAEEFEQTMKVLARFNEAAERHVGFLQQRAGHIEDYLQQR